MFKFLRNARQATDPTVGRPRLQAPEWPAAVYAIGDVHGCYNELRDLERKIIADAATVRGSKWIIMLGDYVDRGPMSAAVIAHVLGTPPAGIKRYCLAGNHEAMMLDFLEQPRLTSDWLRYGGVETLQAYGVDAAALAQMTTDQARAELARSIPPQHVEFLRGLPSLLGLPGAAFVHAGIRPARTLDEQVDHDLMWIREPFLTGPDLGGLLVVHGHTPTLEPLILPHRVALDTAAFKTGVLTAGVFKHGKLAGFLQTSPVALHA